MTIGRRTFSYNQTHLSWNINQKIKSLGLLNISGKLPPTESQQKDYE